ncbi:hypothetical protein KCU78_g9433, partial [Aureobasidium melanogenum]
MDESQVNQVSSGAAHGDDRNTHSGSHDEQHQHLNPMFGGADANQNTFDQDPTLDDFSNAPFDYASLSSLYIPSSELTTDFVSAIPSMDTFEPSYDLLGTAEGKGLEIPHGWSNEYMDAAPLASSLANREIRKSGKSWSQLLADQRKSSHSSGLPRRRSRYRLNRMDSSSTTQSIPIPESSSTERYDPLQRYQNSPPEDDYVSMAAVEQALQSSEFDIMDPNHTWLYCKCGKRSKFSFGSVFEFGGIQHLCQIALCTKATAKDSQAKDTIRQSAHFQVHFLL